MRDWTDNYDRSCARPCEQCGEVCNNRIDVLHRPGIQMRSVWALTTPKKDEKKYGKHPTQKPLDLLRMIVLASTKEGDVILDPFTGSSTTGLAAHLHGREFIGIDTEQKYLDLSRRRYQDIASRTDKIPIRGLWSMPITIKAS
jgi:site-specific DNA-methyltransferase (adenine-specific)